MATRTLGVSHARLLWRAAEKAEIPRGQKARKVFAAVAEKLGLPFPATRADGYRMLYDYLGKSECFRPLKKRGKGPKAASDKFLSTYAWRTLRMQALKLHGARCQCCGATPAHGAVMNVDHIKPRKDFPELALELSNLQVLCHECNHGKGNWDRTDWRQVATQESDYEVQ